MKVRTLLAAGAFALASATAHATEFINVLTGGTSGVYYPLGVALTQLYGKALPAAKTAVQATKASAENLNLLQAGRGEVAFTLGDTLNEAWKGNEEAGFKTPLKKLRTIAAIYPNYIHFLASADSGIKSLADLKGKRVNVGNPRSGQHQNALDALRAAGLVPGTDLVIETSFATEAPRLLQDGRIDAFFCTLGHPSGTLKEAVTGARKVRFIPITGPGIDKLVAQNAYYIRTKVPVARHYAEAEGGADVETFGLVATLNASVRVPEEAVYQLTKAVFDNFDRFREGHPALQDLRREHMLTGLAAPIHPGALRYFREAGLEP